MKKLLYLLLAITFIGCSSDNNSSSNSSNSSNNSVYTIKYQVTTDAPTDNSSGNWGRIRYTNSTGNENEFSTNELFWELEIQINPEGGSYVLLDANNQTGEGLTTAKIYVNGELKGESTGEQGADAYVIYYFPFQP